MKTKAMIYLAASLLVGEFAIAKSIDKHEGFDFSSKDFLALTQEQQIQFINELRDIVIDADLRTEYFASTTASQAQRDVASVEVKVHPSGVVERVYRYTGNLPPNIGLSEEAFKAFEEKAKATNEINRATTADLTLAISILIGDLKSGEEGSGKKAITDQINSILERAAKYKLDEDTKIFLNGQISILKRDEFQVDAKVPSSLLLAESAEKRVSVVAPSKGPVSGPVAGPSKPASKSLTPKATEKSKDPVVRSLGPREELVPTKSTKPSKANEEFYSCLYGGFVVKSACKPSRSLSSEFAKTFIANDKFACEKPTAICNPILFGFEVEKEKEEKVRACAFNKLSTQVIQTVTKDCEQAIRPVCVETSSNMTEQCGKRAGNVKYAMRSTALIQRHPELLDSYLKDLTQLCDKRSLNANSFIKNKANGEARNNSAAVRKDLERTCGIVMARLASLSSVFQIVGKDSTKQLNSIQLPDAKTQK